MRFAILFVALAVALRAGVDTGLLVKVGDYHLKAARYGAAAVADGRYVYAIAGADRHEFFGDIERFDIGTHEVVRVTDKLTPRRYHGAVLANGRIYVIGGESAMPLLSRDGAEPAVDVVDLASGQVTQAAPMPTPRMHAATVLYKGRVYVIGGTVIGARRVAFTRRVDVFDPATNTWSAGPPMPTTRECQAAVVGDFIVVPGGYHVASRVADVEMLVVPEGRWKKLPPLCTRVSAYSLAFLGDHLYLFGNLSAENEVVAYDLRTRTSRITTPGLRPVRHSAAVTHAGAIYVVGGGMRGLSGEAVDDIQVFQIAEP